MKYYSCGICGHYHKAEWNGDCREDAARFSLDDLPDGWEEVPMPGELGDIRWRKQPDGRLMMCKADGSRSIFDDVDE